MPRPGRMRPTIGSLALSSLPGRLASRQPGRPVESNAGALLSAGASGRIKRRKERCRSIASSLWSRATWLCERVLPPERLEQLRADFETLVDRQRRIWAQERGPDDPPGGAWETRPQPRLSPYEPLIDEKTASTVEVWLQENTLGVSRQLMCVPEATSVAGMTLMCNPVRDHGAGAVASRCASDRHGADGGPAERSAGERAQSTAVEHSAVRRRCAVDCAGQPPAV